MTFKPVVISEQPTKVKKMAPPRRGVANEQELEEKKAIFAIRERLKEQKENQVKTVFPIDAFPERIQNIINVFYQCYGLPQDYHATSILVAASIAIGNGYAAFYKRRQVYPPILYAAVVGSPSIGKSPAIDFGIWPLTKIEQNLREQYEIYMEEWREASYKAKLANQPEPDRPVSKDVIINDATVESINGILARNPRGLLLYQDELKAWINSMNSYRKGSDLEYWLSNWSGKFVKISRIGKAAIWIPMPFISVIGGIQPGVLHSLASDGKSDNGFLARILFAYPDDMVCPEESNEEPDETVFALYEKIIRWLYHLPSKVEQPKNEESMAKFNRVEVPLSNEAKERYIQFLNTYSKEVNQAEDEQVQAILGKLKQYCLRFALILELLEMACLHAPEDLKMKINEIEELEIQPSAMENAIRITEYFKKTSFKVIQRFESPVNRLPHHKQIFYEELPVDFEVPSALKIAAEMRKSDPDCKLSDRTVKRMLSDKSLFTRKLGSRGRYEKVFL